MAKKKAVRRAAGADEVRVEHLVATVERVGRMLDAVCAALKSMGLETTVMAARGKAASRLSSKRARARWARILGSSSGPGGQTASASA